MRKIETYFFKRLPTSKKILFTLGILLTTLLFFVSWWGVYAIATYGKELSSFWELDDRLVMLAEGDQQVKYQIAFALHGLFLLLAIGIAVTFFGRAAIRRRLRALMIWGSTSISILGLVIWTSFFFADTARLLFFPVSALEILLLSAILFVPLTQMWFYHRWDHKNGKKRVVIVGGGFAGLYATVELDKILGYHDDLEVVLVDKNNYFLFPPLLPSVAAGSIETRQVTYPFRRIFETTNVCFQKAFVERVDPKAKKIYCEVDIGGVNDDGLGPNCSLVLDYDYLILCPGAETNTFKTKGVAEYGFFMRELGDAVSVRNQVIDCFERAAATQNLEQKREYLRFVLVGAGPTGVEAAAELHDLIHHILLPRYPEIDPSLIDVMLVQSGKGILPGWHQSVVDMSTKQLQRLHLRLVLDNRVVEVTKNSVTLKTGETLPTRTCVWCAGVKPSALLTRCQIPLAEDGRAIVEQDLRIKEYPEIFVLGDSAYLMDPTTQKPFPPLGQVAFQQGPQTAHNLVRLLEGKSSQPFKYFNFGALVSVGENFAVVDLLGIRFSGFIAWFVWRTLYLAKLVGVSNRIRVTIDWTLDLLIERSTSQIFSSRQVIDDKDHV